MKKEYIKKTIIWLKMYEPLKASIEIMESDIKREREKGNIKSLDYSRDKISETYKFSSVVENESIQNIDRIYLLEKKIEITKYTLEKIDKALKVLPKAEKKLIGMRFTTGEYYTWKEISDEIGYSIAHCKGYLKDRAIEKISVAIYGLDAMESVS